MTHVEALAKELERWLPDAQCHVTTPADVSGGPMTVVSLQYALARAALAFARARMPIRSESCVILYAEGWNACRAELLARLGGEEG